MSQQTRLLVDLFVYGRSTGMRLSPVLVAPWTGILTRNSANTPVGIRAKPFT